LAARIFWVFETRVAGWAKDPGVPEILQSLEF